MTPLQDSSKEIEIPKEFEEWAAQEAKRLYPKGSGHYRLIFGQEGVIKGAMAAYRHLHHSPIAWISCKERLPEKFKNVLCYSNKGQYAITCVDASGELDTFHLEVENGAEFFTHWQPLLPPPITGDK